MAPGAPSPFRSALRTGSRRPRLVLKWATLAAALLIAGVWAGGQRTLFLWFLPPDGPRLTAIGVPGGVQWCFGASEDPPTRRGMRRMLPLWALHEPWMWKLRITGTRASTLKVDIPYWLPTLLLLSTSALLFHLDRRPLRWVKSGLCPHCGYDKTGLPTPTSEHGPASPAPCPECGKGA